MCLVHIETRMPVFCQSAHSDACTPLHAAVHCFFNPHIMLQASWKYDRKREWASVELRTKLVSFRKCQKLFAYRSESWDEVGSIVWWCMDSEVQVRAMNYNVKQLTSLAHRRRMTKLKWIVGLYTLHKYAMGEGSNWEKFREQMAYCRLYEGSHHKMALYTPDLHLDPKTRMA